MFIQRPDPVGVNKPLITDRHPIWQAYGGDDLTLRVSVTVPWDKAPATPDNCELSFTLSDQRFTPVEDAIWRGNWANGITEVDRTERPGLLDITIPPAISAALRRGSYIYGLRVSDKDDYKKYTLLMGTLLIEYAPESPTHNIPYHKGS